MKKKHHNCPLFLFYFILLLLSISQSSCSLLKSSEADTNTVDSKDGSESEKNSSEEATDEEEDDEDQGLGSDYNEIELLFEGIRSFDGERYSLAKTFFQKLLDKYPASPLAIIAELKVADSLFHLEQFADAIESYKEFINVHSTNEAKPYAMYQVGLAYQKAYQGAKQDETPLKEAEKAYILLVNQFPNSFFAQKAKLSILECDTLLLQSEKEKIQFYIKTDKKDAARARYETAKKNYGHVKDIDAILGLEPEYFKKTDSKEEDHEGLVVAKRSSQSEEKAHTEEKKSIQPAAVSEDLNKKKEPETENNEKTSANTKDVQELPNPETGHKDINPVKELDNSPQKNETPMTEIERDQSNEAAQMSPRPHISSTPSSSPTPQNSPEEKSIETTEIQEPSIKAEEKKSPEIASSQKPNYKEAIPSVQPTPSVTEPAPKKMEIAPLTSSSPLPTPTMLPSITPSLPSLSPSITSARETKEQIDPDLSSKEVAKLETQEETDKKSAATHGSVNKSLTLGSLESTPLVEKDIGTLKKETEQTAMQAQNTFVKKTTCESNEEQSRIMLELVSAPILRSAKTDIVPGSFGEKTFKTKIILQDQMSIVPHSPSEDLTDPTSSTWKIIPQSQCKNTMDIITIVEKSRMQKDGSGVEPNSIIQISVESIKERKFAISYNSSRDKVNISLK